MFDFLKAKLEAATLFYPAMLALLSVFVYLIFRMIRSIRRLFTRRKQAGEEEFDKLLSDAGYAYDPIQDIFITRMDAWQRKFGYCRLYDEAAVAAGMIIDSEPVRFEYDGKKWLIEFWKGQYHLSTGCEIGVYYTEDPDIAIPNLFDGTFYQCADDANRLLMSYALFKKGRMLFHRMEKHWWLTGFRPGLFSEPWELTMRIRIRFKDRGMCSSFLQAMEKMGYQKHEVSTNGIMVEFMFDQPHSTQPLTRTDETDWIIQRNSERICNQFQEITGEYELWPDKLSALREREPLLYETIINVGKTRKIFKVFDKLKSYV
jgi:hypothetical protein